MRSNGGKGHIRRAELQRGCQYQGTLGLTKKQVLPFFFGNTARGTPLAASDWIQGHPDSGGRYARQRRPTPF